MNAPTDNTPEVAAQEEAVARLIRLAGPRPVPPAEVREQVYAAAQAAWQEKVQARRRRRMAVAMAATIAGIGLLFAALRPGSERAIEAPPAVAAVEFVAGSARVREHPDGVWRPLEEGDAGLGGGAEISTSVAGGVALRLSGGESLRVGQDTRVALPSAGRVRLAEGVVYLDSGSRDAGVSRVRIRTPAGTVRHFGTQYEVRYDAGDLRLRVREGRIELERRDGDLHAGAGEEIRLTASGSVLLSTIERYGAEWTWVQALSVLPEADERSVESLLEWVERETGRRVHYAYPGLKRRAATTMLHGSARGMLPMEVLAVMLQTTDFHYTVTAEEEILIEERAL